jgi:Mg2+ and Co2+ transporter CorA
MIGEEEDDDFISIEVEDHQELKQIEDQTADLILCLDSTLDTVSTFMEMYEHFQTHYASKRSINEPLTDSAYRFDAVLFALREKRRWIGEYRKKAEVLLSKVQNTRTLISSLLERQSGHNTNQQISALHCLEKQGQDENSTMRQLAEKNSRDSSSMRILTIITMIYLPCTIVSVSSYTPIPMLS